jgi:RimJ/RimL family protein N-acetyltransferase
VFDPQPTLTGPTLTMSPAVPDDWAELFAVGVDPLVWEAHPSSDRWREDVFRQFFSDGLASGGMLIARHAASGAVIGSSRFSTEFAEDGEVEIGWTFLSRAHWGGSTNREMKHLMLMHAFDTFGTVIFCVGDNNVRSRRAVEKIGGRLVERPAHDARPDHVTYAIRREDFHGLIDPPSI